MTLREARKAVGWTQQRLEKEARVFQQRISQLERGEFSRVSLDDARNILNAFHRAGLKGLKMADLFPLEESERAS